MLDTSDAQFRFKKTLLLSCDAVQCRTPYTDVVTSDFFTNLKMCRVYFFLQKFKSRVVFVQKTADLNVYSGVPSLISEGDIFVYSCSAQLFFF